MNLVSGTGLTVTQHAIKRWIDRREDELTLFSFEAALSGALKQNSIRVADLRGNNKVTTPTHTFIIRNRTVVTYYRT